MNISAFKHLIIASVLSATFALGGCSGGGSGGGGTPPAPANLLSGTAAAGAAVIGTVTVKGALGNVTSALIEADGTYDVDVTGLTAPYRLRAQGTVGGRQVKLFSYAVESDIGGTVNITPFTDLIIANVAGQIAESFFDQTEQVNPLDEAEIEAQEAELQAKLQDVLSAVGVGTAIDLLRTSFSADHSGLDAALDIIRVEVDPLNSQATLTNLVEGGSITDSFAMSEPTDTVPVADPAALLSTATENQQIKALFDGFAAAFATTLPSPAAIQDHFADDFLEGGYNKSLFLTDITTDPTMIGSFFSGIVVTNLDTAATPPTAEVTFSFGSNGVIEPEAETWFVTKDPTLGWQFSGDQRIVDTYFGFHCNDYNGFVNDNASGWGCGINTQFWDEVFTDNPGGTPIASGRVRIIDGTDGTTVKDEFYLGTPTWATAGDVQVYNEANSGSTPDDNYQGDYRGFGTAAGEIDPSIFAAGDIIEYALYTADLDVTTPTAPAVVGVAVATYTDTLYFAPDPTTWSDADNLMPTATSATQTAIQSYSLGSDLTIGWTLAAGTRIEEILVQITDSAGDQVEIWDWIYGSTATSVTYSAAELDTSALLQTDTSYELRVRIYATDEVNGQTHSRDYAQTITGPAGTGTGGCDVTGLTTLADFTTTMTGCSTFVPYTANDLIGNSVEYATTPGEIFEFTDASNGQATFNSTAYSFTWSVTAEGFVKIDFTGFGFSDWWAITSGTATNGTIAAFTDEDNTTFTETIVPWGASSLTCGYESGWNDLADGGLGAPVTPNSFADFEAVVADCGTAMSITANQIAGLSLNEQPEVTTFNAFSGSEAGTQANPGTGTYFENDGSGFQLNFEWYVETVNGVDYVVVYSDETIDSSITALIGAGFWFRETSALTSFVDTDSSGTLNTNDVMAFYKYSEQSNYSDTNRATNSDGEIWISTNNTVQ